MILFTDEEIRCYIEKSGLKDNEYVIVDNLKTIDECLLDYSKKIFVRNLMPNNQMCNTNSKVLLSYIERLGLDVDKFIESYKLHDKSFLNNYFEWMPSESAHKFFNDIQKFIGNDNPRIFEKYATELVFDQQNLSKFINLLTKLLAIRITYENAYIYNRNFNNDQTLQFITAEKKKGTLKIIILFKTFNNFENYFNVNHLYWFAGNLLSIPIIKGNRTYKCNYTYYAYELIKLLEVDYSYMNLKVNAYNNSVFVNNIEYARKVVLKKQTIKCRYSIQTRLLNLLNKLFKNKQYIRPSSYDVFSPRVFDLNQYKHGDIICYHIIRNLKDNTGEYILKKDEFFNLPYTRLDIEINMNKKILGSSIHPFTKKKDFKTYLENLKTENEKAKKAEAKLTELNKELEEKVKERTLELERMKNTIEENSRQKTDFFINLAHETKTPLTLIKNYLEQYIRKTGETNEIMIVKDNIDKLTRDMVNFIDSEKIEQNKVIFNEIETLNISELLNQKIILFQHLAQKKDISISDEVAPGINIRIDPYALDRIVNNLIDNAIRYSNINGKIIITLQETVDEQVCLSVADDGPGIPAGKQKYIFDKYFQISKSKKNVQGIGMGLYITKCLVEMFDGKIDFVSNEDEGTKFDVTFQISREETTEKEVVVSPPDVSITGTKNIKVLPFDTGKQTLLLVEDHVDLLEYLKESLEDKYNICWALNGKMALKILKENPGIDLIISDIMMDEMDGFELLKCLSIDTRWKGIPVIFLTAKSTQRDKIVGLKLGAVDYIYKPFNITEIKEKVKSRIRIKKFEKALFQREKFAAIGKLVAGVAHQIINPLSGITAPIERALEYLENDVHDERITGLLKRAEESTFRIEKLVRSLKVLSYNSNREEKVPIRRLTTSIINLFTEDIKHRISFKIEVPEDLIFMGSISSFNNVFLNLFHNSIEAIPGKGEVKIESFYRGKDLVILVTDNGPGIKDEDVKEIFNMDFTTKEIGQGSGMGLFIVRELVYKMGWEIEVESEVGKGTRFLIIRRG